MSKLQNIVIIGVSDPIHLLQSCSHKQGAGNLGPAVLKELLAADFTVTALTRPGSKSTFLPGAEVVNTDYSTESLLEIFKGKDAILSLINAGALADLKRIIDAAVKAGVRRFVPSEFGSDTSDPHHVKVVPIFASKVAVVDYLRTKEAEGLTWTALCNGPFFDWVSFFYLY